MMNRMGIRDRFPASDGNFVVFTEKSVSRKVAKDAKTRSTDNH